MTPLGRLRTLTPIGKTKNYKNSALLNYPRPHDIENAYNAGIIDKDQRANYLALAESIRTNPNRKGENKDVRALMRSSSSGIGTSVLIHDTKAPILVKKGWTSAGCYTFTNSDMKAMSKKYLGAGSELIGIPSTGEAEEIKRPYKSIKSWRKNQKRNQAALTQDMEDYLKRAGILQANRERLASHLMKKK